MLQKIEEYRYISLFLHIKPDFDAYASLFSLYHWIKVNFPTKAVVAHIKPEELSHKERILFDFQGDKILTQMPKRELQLSLGIVLDTPNQQRVLTQKHFFCRELIIIDHHPKIEDFAQLEFINPTYSSTSEILASLFLFFEQEYSYLFESKISKYLYSGIITDSNQLKENITPHTYYVLWKLFEKGISRKEIHEIIEENGFNRKLFDQKVVKRIRISPNGLAFAIVNARILKKYSIKDYLSAITNLEDIAGIEIRVIFIQDRTIKGWKCSMRSKTLPLDKIAMNFRGGGHKKSASIIFKNRREFWALLLVLDDYLIKFGFSNNSNYGKLGRSWMLQLYRLFCNFFGFPEELK